MQNGEQRKETNSFSLSNKTTIEIRLIQITPQVTFI